MSPRICVVPYGFSFSPINRPAREMPDTDFEAATTFCVQVCSVSVFQFFRILAMAGAARVENLKFCGLRSPLPSPAAWQQAGGGPVPFRPFVDPTAPQSTSSS
jgi:hypothetical protein